MAQSIWQKMKTHHAMSRIATLVTGIIITAFLWWFFGGLWFGELPGLAILFIGVAEILYTVYRAFTEQKSTLLRVGLLMFFIGVAGYLSFLSHVMLGTLQLTFMAVVAIGLVLLVLSAFSARKPSA